MKALFDMISDDAEFMNKCKINPILGASFYALNEFVKTGNELAALPWFGLTKMSTRKQAEISKAA